MLIQIIYYNEELIWNLSEFFRIQLKLIGKLIAFSALVKIILQLNDILAIVHCWFKNLTNISSKW